MLQTYSQIQIKRAFNLLHESRSIEAHTIIDEEMHFISTSEIYYQVKGDILRAENNYEMAIESYSTAFRYAPTPHLAMRIALCAVHLGKINDAIDYLHLASHIQPSLFEPYYHLMEVYSQFGDKTKAKAMAVLIIRKPIKIDSDKVQHYKKNAAEYLQTMKIP